MSTEPGLVPPAQPCTCRDYSCASSYDMAFRLHTGHHPVCTKRPERRPNSDELIGTLVGTYLQLEADNARLAGEQIHLVSSLNTYTNTGSKLFAEVNAIAERALGRPVEPGHTAAHAVQQLADKLAEAEAELALVRRIVALPLEQTLAEVKHLEPGSTAAACKIIDLWNRLSNAQATARVNRDLLTENAQHRRNLEEAATELLVPIPDPGTDLAKLLQANVLLRKYRLPELEAALANLRTAYARENEEISQTLGRALGYPRYCDDQANFPGATEADGVCTGEHVAATLALEAAERIGSVTATLTQLREVLRKSSDDHITLAGEYEASGNTRGAIQLRAAGNLLGVIVQGGTPLTVCPPGFVKAQVLEHDGEPD